MLNESNSTFLSHISIKELTAGFCARLYQFIALRQFALPAMIVKFNERTGGNKALSIDDSTSPLNESVDLQKEVNRSKIIRSHLDLSTCDQAYRSKNVFILTFVYTSVTVAIFCVALLF